MVRAGKFVSAAKSNARARSKLIFCLCIIWSRTASNGPRLGLAMLPVMVSKAGPRRPAGAARAMAGKALAAMAAARNWRFCMHFSCSSEFQIALKSILSSLNGAHFALIVSLESLLTSCHSSYGMEKDVAFFGCYCVLIALR